MELICNRCETSKPAEAFVKRVKAEPYSQRNVRCCKECNRKRNKDRYHENPEVRSKLRDATKKWADKNRDKVQASHNRYVEKNKPKRQAKDYVKGEIRQGRMTRMPCEVCMATTDVHGHHDSYEPERWTDVRWLCRTHHKGWHRVLDPLKVEGEGKKIIDKAFSDYIIKK
jgi:hypothetical protein